MGTHDVLAGFRAELAVLDDSARLARANEKAAQDGRRYADAMIASAYANATESAAHRLRYRIDAAEAALLVGEGEAGPLRGPLEDAIAWLERESRRAYEAADRHAGGGKDSDHVRGLLITRGELHKTIADRLRHFSTPPAPPDLPAPSVSMHPVDCLACGKRFASLSNANGQWCLACIEKRAADNRTPGQVAYEGFYSDGCAAWSLVRPEVRARYEACAAAVLAHGRGER